jgi:hypothetical protein
MAIFEDAQEGVVKDFLGIEPITEDRAEIGEEPGLVPRIERIERGQVARPHACEKNFVGLAEHRPVNHRPPVKVRRKKLAPRKRPDRDMLGAMPSAAVVVACALLVLIVILLIVRARSKTAAPAEPRFEPPRELVPRPQKEPEPQKEVISLAPGATFPTEPPPEPTAVIEAVVPPQAVPPRDEPSHTAAMPAPPLSPPRQRLPSYSDISDEAVASEVQAESVPTAPPPPSEPHIAPPAPVKPLAPAAPRVTPSQPKIGARSEPRIAPPKVASEPKIAAKVASEPKIAAKVKSEPNVPVAPRSEPRVAAKAPAPKPEEHDFSALNDAKAAPAAPKVAPAAARYVPPSNPETAELEKGDPRHAAARRFARVSVSEIKLYHEEEVKAGREASDLWTRLAQDIGLAKQTFEARVDKEVRERFDYLYDEIVRQLAEGDPKKLGPGAPPPRAAAAAAPAQEDEGEAPTKTVMKTLPEPQAEATPFVAEAPLVTTPSRPPPEPAPPAEAPKLSALAARLAPSNPETAELEKGDPRHAAARRLARLSVSEIKLYHEDEVKAGREAKDLWTRLAQDISMAVQTFEKRVDKEVRERFDYLFDEILRQLADGDAEKLGPSAPKRAAAAAPSPSPAAAAPAAAPAPAPARAPGPVAPAAAAPVAPAAPPPAAPAPAAPSPAAAAAPDGAAATAEAKRPALPARFAPPQNPATAELEKNDPRHAAARRLARLSVSEIKLYHEDEVKAGREARDLWKRLITDIGLATQTYEKRVDKEVRERFDYLYDEILRQLAEGDVEKLGADAPKPKT